MVALAYADLGAVLEFVRESDEVAGLEPFPPELLDRLRELMAADAVRYCEQDRVAQRTLYGRGCSISNAMEPSAPDADEAFWLYRPENPILRHHETGDFAACKLSDFLTRRGLHRLGLYREVFRPAGIEHRFVVGLPAPQSHTKAFLVDRADGRDFGERDRIVLNVLRPHLAAAYAAARDRRLAAALSRHEPGAGGLISLGLAGRIDWIAPQAEMLLARYLGGRVDGRLPEPLESWLAAGAPGAVLTTRRDPSRLHVRCLGRTLLLWEEPSVLTAREEQILELVAVGRSNAQIAKALWISSGTVRIHLQHIYAKLGVRSRTEAAARLREGRRTGS